MRLGKKISTALLLAMTAFRATSSGGAEYDPAFTITALNMAIVSVHRITATEDRVVLDLEYKNIINNLSLGNIEDDPELKELYKDVMEATRKKALRQDESARVAGMYDAREKNRFVSLLASARASVGNPWSFIGGILAGEVTAYFGAAQFAAGDRAELDEALWKLELENLEEYAELQKRLLDSSWTLLRRYGLPDSYRLAQQDLDAFDMAVRETDPEKSSRMFKALEPNMGMYAPFWYYRATSAIASGDADAAGRFLDEFERVWRPVLRHDPFRAEAAKIRAGELERAGAPGKDIAAQLRILTENTARENWINNLYAGVAYYSIGEREKAMECVSVNVDFDIEREISPIVLQNMKDGKHDASIFADSIQSTIIASQRGYEKNGQNAAAERGLIAWFRGDSETAAQLMNGLLASPTNADPLPRHVLANLVASAAPAGEIASLITSLPNITRLEPLRDEALKSAPRAAYESLLPIVERYAGDGSANAKNFLADMYLSGSGVQRDAQRAVELYKSAAGSGDAYAFEKLGEIFETYEGLKDEALSAGYYGEAASRGLPQAALRLGDMCRDGRGTAKNLEDAYMWYALALLEGDSAAQGRIDELEGRGLLTFKSVNAATAKRARERAQKLHEEIISGKETGVR